MGSEMCIRDSQSTSRGRCGRPTPLGRRADLPQLRRNQARPANPLDRNRSPPAPPHQGDPRPGQPDPFQPPRPLNGASSPKEVAPRSHPASSLRTLRNRATRANPHHRAQPTRESTPSPRSAGRGSAAWVHRSLTNQLKTSGFCLVPPVAVAPNLAQRLHATRRVAAECRCVIVQA